MQTQREAEGSTAAGGSGEAQANGIDRWAPNWLDRTEYPFRNRWVRLQSGESMHYVDEGSGEVMLLVHGTPSWSFEWRHLIGALSDRHRCIAPDHLGFGLSDRPRDGAYTPEWHARNLSAFVDALGLQQFTLVVHDFGGPIGVPLALDRSAHVSRLILMNTWLWSFEGERTTERIARVMGGRFGRLLYERVNLSLRVIMPQAYLDKRKLTRSIHAQYLAPFPDAASRGRVLWQLAHSLLGSSSYYESLWRRRGELRGRPTLIIWGMKDPAFGPRHLERWREALPEAEVASIDTGHWPHEERSDEVVAAVARFLS